jgi:adenosylcobinamide-GDP ribazoletransferase
VIARRLAEAQVAAMTLTRLPAGRIDGQAPGIGDGAWAFPLVGAVVGGLGWVLFAGAGAAGLPAALAAVVAVFGMVAATGALHEDGLADVADGFGGGHEPAQKLAIMRDSRIGSFGALALVALIGVRVAAISALAAAGGLFWEFVAIQAVSRGAVVAIMQAEPPARENGLGHSASRPGSARTAAALAAALALALPLGATGLALALGVAAAGAGVAALARRQIGGQTGDVLGAVQAASEAAGWLVLAAAAGRAG